MFGYGHCYIVPLSSKATDIKESRNPSGNHARTPRKVNLSCGIGTHVLWIMILKENDSAVFFTVGSI